MAPWKRSPQTGRRAAGLAGLDLREPGQRIRPDGAGETLRRHQQSRGWIESPRAVVDRIRPDHSEGPGRAIPESSLHLAAHFQVCLLEA